MHRFLSSKLKHKADLGWWKEAAKTLEPIPSCKPDLEESDLETSSRPWWELRTPRGLDPEAQLLPEEPQLFCSGRGISAALKGWVQRQVEGCLEGAPTAPVCKDQTKGTEREAHSAACPI